MTKDSFDQPNDIEQLINPRLISRADSIGRAAVAAELQEAVSTKKRITLEKSESEIRLSQLHEKLTTLFQEKRQLETTLAQYRRKLFVKLVQKFGVTSKKEQGLQAKIGLLQTDYRDLESEVWEAQAELKVLEQQQKSLREPGEIRDRYFEQIASEPLTIEQKRNFLKPELLSKLSTEQYIALWRRLNPFFLAHTTRQGFRDHSAMVYHQSGIGEFHNGFLNVVADQRLIRPPIALDGLKDRGLESVKEWLGDWILKADNHDLALQRLQSLLHFSFGSAPKYPDSTAIHFSAQIVADDFYGGESGNEVFFIYPTDAIASQHNFAFNGKEKTFVSPQSERKWNDVFVWPSSIEDQVGISIDAGFVFLPKNTLVDPETGSKYASETRNVDGKEQRVRVEDQSLVSEIINWLGQITEDSSIAQTIAFYMEEGDVFSKERYANLAINQIASELVRIGVVESLASDFATNIFYSMIQKKTFLLDPEFINKLVIENGVQYKKAENPIPSGEYWENMFKVRPDLKPKHIIYYEGDPSSAVLDFQEKNKIGSADTSVTDGNLLGFDDNHVDDMWSDPRANRGYEELRQTAEQIINEAFAAT